VRQPASFCIGCYVLSDGIANHGVAMTMAFLTLAGIQLLHAYNSRSTTHSLFGSNPFSNDKMNMAFLAGVILTLVPFIPAFQGFFGISPLTFGEYAIAIGCALAIIPIVELQKWIERLFSKKRNKSNAEE